MSLSPEILHLIDSGAMGSISRTIRALRKARSWCERPTAAVTALEEQPLMPYDERRLYIDRVRDEALVQRELDRLRALVDQLEVFGLAPGRARGPIFAAIGDVLGLLERTDRVPRCLGYLRLRRWQARAMACRLLRDEDLSSEEVQTVCEAIEILPQRMTVELAARNADCLTNSAALEIVLPRLETEYWQSRVIEELLGRPEVDLAAVSQRWPMGTLWSIARARRVDLLHLVAPRLPLLEAEWRTLPIVTWALGRLAANVDLDDLEQRLRSRPEWAEYARINT
jgi:hypothetical protein